MSAKAKLIFASFNRIHLNHCSSSLLVLECAESVKPLYIQSISLTKTTYITCFFIVVRSRVRVREGLPLANLWPHAKLCHEAPGSVPKSSLMLSQARVGC